MPPKNSKRASAIAPNPRAVQNGEVLQRLNFLHQALTISLPLLDRSRRTQLSKTRKFRSSSSFPSNQPRSRHLVFHSSFTCPWSQSCPLKINESYR
ncbi:hypothetical protein KEM48_006166 [Puccinia striiformis f. sp. tritici PST-130]|nr:hypothetical protein KEM48_006166 [Puccinia striiformis f. sp. tritici PST-130]